MPTRHEANTCLNCHCNLRRPSDLNPPVGAKLHGGKGMCSNCYRKASGGWKILHVKPCDDCGRSMRSLLHTRCSDCRRGPQAASAVKAVKSAVPERQWQNRGSLHTYKDGEYTASVVNAYTIAHYVVFRSSTPICAGYTTAVADACKLAEAAIWQQRARSRQRA